MESYSTEDEQVEALRKWWQENSKSTIAAIVFALAAGYGWQGWQKHTVEQAESASAVYQDLLEAVNLSSPAGLSEEQILTARHLANNLKEDYASTTYAQFAALQLARLAVNDSELAEAEAELRWVLTQNPDEDIQKVAQVRLARVVAAQGDTQAALDMLALDAGAYGAVYSEARGDVYLQLEQTEQALSAYLEAASYNQLNGVANTPDLDLKLQALQLEAPRAVANSAEQIVVEGEPDDAEG